nr:SUKH-4 family immunity protein [Nonomuraea sp. FMUSA5-5]
MTESGGTSSGPFQDRRIVYLDDDDIGASAAAYLVQEGVPPLLVGLSYVAADTLRVAQSPTRGELICFGKAGPSSTLCVARSNGEVIQIVEVDSGEYEEELVNSSLDQFARSVEAVNDRYPFYSLDCDIEVCEAVSEEIAERLRRIDPVALEDGRFWDTVVADMMMGDYATEMIGTHAKG